MAPGLHDILAFSPGSNGVMGAIAAGLLAAALPFALGRLRGTTRAGLLGAFISFVTGVAAGTILAAPVVAGASYMVARRRSPPAAHA